MAGEDYDVRHEAAMIMATMDELTTRVKRLVNIVYSKEKKITILDDSMATRVPKATVTVEGHASLEDEFPETYENKARVTATKF